MLTVWKKLKNKVISARDDWETERYEKDAYDYVVSLMDTLEKENKIEVKSKSRELSETIYDEIESYLEEGYTEKKPSDLLKDKIKDILDREGI